MTNNDKILINQRLPGRIGCLGGIDKKLQVKENKSKKCKCKEIEKLTHSTLQLSGPSTSNYHPIIHNQSADTSLSSSSSSDSEYIQRSNIQLSENKRGLTNFITPKLVAAMDRCKLSVQE